MMVYLFDGHVNIEYGASSELPVYLYKYFYKGPDFTGWKVDSNDMPMQRAAAGTAGERVPIDEIKNYERGRCLTDSEAAHRLSGKAISVESPGTTRLPIHLPGKQFTQLGRKCAPQSNATLLMRYLDRPRDPRLDNATYCEYAELCHPVTHDPTKPFHELEILEPAIPGRPQMRLRFYRESHETSVRMQNVNPRHGDVFYLRCILNHWAVRSFLQARTVDGTIYNTYQEAARAMGLFTTENEAELAFGELIQLGVTPAHLRWMFCLLAVEGHPMIRMWELHQEAMYADMRDRLLQQGRLANPNVCANDLLQELQETLASLGKRLRDIGLPEPVARRREVDMEILLWGGDPDNLTSFESSLTSDQVCYITCQGISFLTMDISGIQ
jgi:hypothetical protein